MSSFDGPSGARDLMSKKREFDLKFAMKRGDQLCSPVWRVWKNKSDIYVVQARIGGFLNTSLHANLQCRVALTKERYEQLTGVSPEGGRPALVSWTRQQPRDMSSDTAVSILFAPEFLSSHYTSDVKDFIAVEVPDVGSAIEISMRFSLASPDRFTCDATESILGYTKLENDQFFIVLKKYIQFDINDFHKSVSLPKSSVVDFSDPASPDATVDLWDISHGYLRVVEISTVWVRESAGSPQIP